MGKLIVTVGIRNQQGEQLEAPRGDRGHRVYLHRSTQGAAGEARSARASHGASRLADGRTVPVDIGWTVFRLEGQVFPTQVTFAVEGEPPLLGAVTLEEALLAVDPVGQRLIPVEADRLCPAGLDDPLADAELPFEGPRTKGRADSTRA